MCYKGCCCYQLSTRRTHWWESVHTLLLFVFWRHGTRPKRKRTKKSTVKFMNVRQLVTRIRVVQNHSLMKYRYPLVSEYGLRIEENLS